MPILGVKGPIPGTLDSPDPQYFRSLKELDDWLQGRRSWNANAGVVEYVARKHSESGGKGKLLVCHDYKGGYVESPFARSYTFNFWSSCDTFVYFSHNRITIPPPGWISAAHRQGVKMLGTLIFEGGGEEDCLRLIVGKIPQSKTGQSQQSNAPLTLPLSPRYARVLADLAKERGFDGYLLNFECPLQGGFEQTRALAAWITLLQSEILAKVGPHGQTIWYDSIIFTGQLAWQDRLNNFNLPFFLSSSGLFSNYTWYNDYPSLTAQYFLSLDVNLTGQTPDQHPHVRPKTLQDVYMGIDVWGRGSHGGGGFGSYKALSHIAPESLGLSVALFGQAWTWESEQDKPGWTWDQWWEYDTKLWVGPQKGFIDVPEVPNKEGESECIHGPFIPISSFFPRYPPPDPLDLPFHTTFCPGVGQSWFVQGSKKFECQNGWTDIDKQTTVGDMVWPGPTLYWADEREDELPIANPALDMSDAWNGGSSLHLTISCGGSEADTAAYRVLWLPIQSLALTPHRLYEAHIVYKIQPHSHSVDTEFALGIRDPSGEDVTNITSSTTEALTEGWTKLSIQFDLPVQVSGPISSCIGFTVAILTDTPTEPLQVSFLTGQVNVHPHLPQSFHEHNTYILWADFTPAASSSSATGTLTWEVATSFPPVPFVSITSPDDPTCAWNLQPTNKWFPSFLYFNIYAQQFIDEWNVGSVENALWIGTSGIHGKKNSFVVLEENLPFKFNRGPRKIRYTVQGVSEEGNILTWARCAYVDVTV